MKSFQNRKTNKYIVLDAELTSKIWLFLQLFHPTQPFPGALDSPGRSFCQLRTVLVPKDRPRLLSTSLLPWIAQDGLFCQPSSPGLSWCQKTVLGQANFKCKVAQDRSLKTWPPPLECETCPGRGLLLLETIKMTNKKLITLHKYIYFFAFLSVNRHLELKLTYSCLKKLIPVSKKTGISCLSIANFAPKKTKIT